MDGKFFARFIHTKLYARLIELNVSLKVLNKTIYTMDKRLRIIKTIMVGRLGDFLLYSKEEM